jgi:hypothetical protein
MAIPFALERAGCLPETSLPSRDFLSDGDSVNRRLAGARYCARTGILETRGRHTGIKLPRTIAASFSRRAISLKVTGDHLVWKFVLSARDLASPHLATVAPPPVPIPWPAMVTASRELGGSSTGQRRGDAAAGTSENRTTDHQPPWPVAACGPESDPGRNAPHPMIEHPYTGPYVRDSCLRLGRLARS